MKRTIFATVAALGLVGSSPAWLQAADEPANSPPATRPATPSGEDAESGVEDVALAQNLANWGRKHQNPAAIALAGKIMASVPTQDLPNPSKTTKSKDKNAAGGGAKTPAKPLDAAALAAEANAMAGNDAGSQAAVAAVGNAKVVSRGRVEGALKHDDVVNAGAADCYELTFKGDELNEVGVASETGSGLTLIVTDAESHLISSSEGGSAGTAVSFRLPQTTKVKIYIVNKGPNEIPYTLLTN